MSYDASTTGDTSTSDNDNACLLFLDSVRSTHVLYIVCVYYNYITIVNSREGKLKINYPYASYRVDRAVWSRALPGSYRSFQGKVEDLTTEANLCITS